MGARETLDIEELLRDNQDLRDQQQAIGAVLRAVARSEGLEAVFQTVVQAATRLCHADFGALYLADGDTFRLSTRHTDEPGLDQYEREHPHVRDQTTAIGRVALTRDIVHIPDVQADSEYAWGGGDVAEYRTVLAVPILVDDDIANARLLDAVERQRSELSRFVSPQVAALLSSEDGKRLLVGHRAYISVLFSDLRGFTEFVETAAPEELFELLREYHALVGELVPAYDATLEHFAGDGVMMFFNDPAPVAEHELQAIRMALALQQRFDELALVWRKRGTELRLGIGIAAGYATLGRIGFEGRYDYGALGPVTNVASRLSTRAHAGQVLISQRIFAAVENEVDAQPIGGIELKGFARPVTAYEIAVLHS